MSVAKALSLTFVAVLAFAWNDGVSAAEPNDLEQLETYLNRVSVNYSSAIQKSRKNSQSMVVETFERDLAQFRYYAKNVQEKVVQLGIKDINVLKYANHLSQTYFDLRRKGSDISDDNLRQTEPRFAMTKTREAIDKIKQMGVYQSGRAPVYWKNEKTEKRDQPPPEEWTRERLAKVLWAKRDEIIKGDDKIEGLSAATVNEYLRTLTREQKSEFSSLKKKYTNRDFGKDDADSAALMELHGRLRNHPERFNVDEVKSILIKLGEIEKEKRTAPGGEKKEKNK